MTVPVLLRDRFLFESGEAKPVPARTGTGEQLVDVAIPLPINDPYTYQVPVHLTGKLQAGCRVRVPIKNRSIIGYAVALDSEREVKKPKEIIEIIDQEPVLSDHFLRLTKWISEHYFSSWGEAISNAIPRSLHISSPRSNFPPQGGREHVRQNFSDFHLTEEQQIAFQKINERILKNHHAEIFLFGVTGGGKSELYIRAIKEVLKQGKSAICLVPEIALTDQLKHFFVHHFHGQLEVLHSKLTDKERSEAWHRIRSEEKQVVLGARSAVFAPTPHLGLMIMDEEQEGSYKQDQSPRYHAREVARWRAQDCNALFIMGTATPTLETMQRTLTGEVEILTLSKRIGDRPMPKVRIIDLKQADEIMKKHTIVSPQLRNAIDQALAAKGGILIMLNRRGYSTNVRCFKCGNVLFCSHCTVTLTFHQDDQEVICHYCNFHTAVPKTCAKCESPLFKFSGVGTEKVESEVARLFPNARIARLDTDSTRKRGAHEQILAKFRTRQIDILVGTQMIAKGFDFQHVTLVGIINADTGLLLPDFRSAEKTFQLLTQMSGRTGRGKDPGIVLVQTYSPNHYAVQFASKHDFQGFFLEEVGRRKALQYPPFTRIVNVVFRGKKEQAVQEQAHELRKLLEKRTESLSVELMGPAPLPLYRLRGHFRWHLMLRASDTKPMQIMVKAALEHFKRKVGVYVAIDVDPITIL